MGRRPTKDYQAAEQAGRRAEYLTRFLYHLAGYRCVTMRQKTPFGELDLIMQRGQKILVLEVKFRQRMDDFDGGLPGHQQIKRMRNAVLWVSGRYPVLPTGYVFCGWFSGRAGGAYAKPISISRR